MAFTWHNRAVQELLRPLLQSEGATYWRAERYRRSKPPKPARVEAVPTAVWKRFTPFADYRPTGKRRDVEAGPHVSFLKLKNILRNKPRQYRTALEVFVHTYGLLGLFYERYSPPIPPNGKVFVLPEAVIDKHGRLRRVDPSAEGVQLLLSLLQRQRFLADNQEREAIILEELTASPSEMEFAQKRSVGLWPANPSGQEMESQRVPWEEARSAFGALLVLDEESPSRVSVLCTCEPYGSWEMALDDFPSGPYSTNEVLAARLNRELMEVSPYGYISEEGQYERGWRCPSLLRAMYLMLFLDLTGGSTIRECASLGCTNYFRVGPRSRAIYCTEQCANRASTRMGRGQEP